MIQFSAHFDGKHLCPDEPVSLPENVPLRVTVDGTGPSSTESGNRPVDLFDRLEAKSGLIEGPADWSAEHDHYLSGAPKKSDGSED